MDKKAIQTLIQEKIKSKLGDNYKISIQEVLKTNIKLDGLTILQSGENISPTIYLNSFYRDLENGDDIELVIGKILMTYFKYRTDGHFDTSNLLEYELLKERLYVKLINKHLNEELLSDVPHKNFLDDFAIIPQVLVSMEEEGNACFTIHNNHLKLWNIDTNELLNQAIENTRNIFEVSLQNMASVMKELGFELPNELETPMWVLTNHQKLNGAAMLIYEDILQDFANQYGDFYIIGSSIHEVLLIPANANMNIEELTEMNLAVNASEVNLEDILGTKAYFYSREKGITY